MALESLSEPDSPLRGFQICSKTLESRPLQSQPCNHLGSEPCGELSTCGPPAPPSSALMDISIRGAHSSQNHESSAAPVRSCSTTARKPENQYPLISSSSLYLCSRTWCSDPSSPLLRPADCSGMGTRRGLLQQKSVPRTCRSTDELTIQRKGKPWISCPIYRGDYHSLHLPAAFSNPTTSARKSAAGVPCSTRQYAVSHGHRCSQSYHPSLLLWLCDRSRPVNQPVLRDNLLRSSTARSTREEP